MHRLKAQPLRRYHTPAYPPKLDVLAMPGLLAKHQPPAWVRNAEIAGAAGLFLTANAAGCAKPTPPPLAANAPAIVAPIFEHGEGRASEGCVVSFRLTAMQRKVY